MARKITYEIVKQEFDDRGYILISDVYVNNAQKLKYICPKHKDKGIQEITFANFTKGSGCPYCAKRVKRTHEEYVIDLAKVNKNIEPLEDYVNLKTKILHRCKVCGYEWKIKPTNLLHLKQGCPHCNGRAKLTHSEIVEIIFQVNPNIELLDTYIDDITKIRFRCKECGHIWYAKPNNIRNGKGCPKCSSSKGEKCISKYLDEHNIEYIQEYIFPNCKDETYLRFDFYLPQHNICIEYDGIQHFQPIGFSKKGRANKDQLFAKVQKHDKIKNDYCATNGIKLIRIPYYDYNEIQQILSKSLI